MSSSVKRSIITECRSEYRHEKPRQYGRQMGFFVLFKPARISNVPVILSRPGFASPVADLIAQR